MKYACGLVLLAKGEAVLQGVIGSLNGIGRYYGKEVNVYLTNVKRLSEQPSAVQIMIDQKQLENVEYFSYLCTLKRNDAPCT